MKRLLVGTKGRRHRPPCPNGGGDPSYRNAPCICVAPRAVFFALKRSIAVLDVTEESRWSGAHVRAMFALCVAVRHDLHGMLSS